MRLIAAHGLKKWPGLKIDVMAVRPGETAAYPAISEINGNVLVWHVTDADTAIGGHGSIEVRGIANGIRKLSATAKTYISPAMAANEKDPPEAAKPWVDQVLDAAQRAEDAAQRAEDANDRINTDAIAPENAGKLLYIGQDGILRPLGLGRGLEIRDGMLVITAEFTPNEDVLFQVNDAGNLMMTGVSFIQGDGGDLILQGAGFELMEDGTLLIK